MGSVGRRWRSGGFVVACLVAGGAPVGAQVGDGPRLIWSAPADDDVARPHLHLSARCESAVGSCSELRVLGADGRVLAAGGTSVNAEVSLGYADGRAEALTLVGRDGTGTAQVTRSVYVESGAGLIAVDRAAPPFRLVDADGRRTVVADADRAFWVHDRAARVTTPIGGLAAFPSCYGAELSRNAVVVACQQDVLVWRGAGPAERVGDGALWGVQGSTAAWFVPEGVRVRDLTTGAVRTVGFDVTAAYDRTLRVALAPSGEVAFLDPLDGRVALFADRQGRMSLMRDRLPGVSHMAYDGGSAGYVRRDAGSSVWLHRDGVDERLSEWSDPARPADAITVRAGYVAYERRASAHGPVELRRRDPYGREDLLLACTGACRIEALGDDGSVSLLDQAAHQRLVAPIGGTPQVVSSDQGHARWRVDALVVFLGRMAFLVGSEGPVAPEALPQGAAFTAPTSPPAPASVEPAETLVAAVSPIVGSTDSPTSAGVPPEAGDRAPAGAGCSAAGRAVGPTAAFWLLLLTAGVIVARRGRPF